MREMESKFQLNYKRALPINMISKSILENNSKKTKANE
jgi:hypothetical protein